MSFRLGLTGSIGMGKSTTAAMFADEGCAVWDADAAVHRLYSGAAVPAVGAVFPNAIVDGTVSREALKQIISSDSEALGKLEAIIHPLVRQDRARFAREAEADILVFDIPLLFETGSRDEFDAVTCVTVSPEIQRERVLARGTMTQAQFEMILAKQMPITENVALSDYVVVTDTVDHARTQVRDVVADIKRRMADA
ncbi:dephospho-CoA kinase [Primorskyibacter sedentarius]|uniref:Dephospho-CoA kinase n=1 Tax=Primorskyibacter sedentarius TaxID=745311 RepID=A0A4R3JLC5_9RHOB|nr:dephospho-CoA kinase [Primorskyibacter sedentarius]TCS66380.1 dephospho-CoA kinase [Primorskyibacter sedentarius]